MKFHFICNKTIPQVKKKEKREAETRQTERERMKLSRDGGEDLEEAGKGEMK